MTSRSVCACARARRAQATPLVTRIARVQQRPEQLRGRGCACACALRSHGASAVGRCVSGAQPKQHRSVQRSARRVARRAAGAVGTMAAAAAHTDRREDAHGRLSGRHERSHDPQRSSAFGTLCDACSQKVFAFSPFCHKTRPPTNFIHTLEKVGGGGGESRRPLCRHHLNTALQKMPCALMAFALLGVCASRCVLASNTA